MRLKALVVEDCEVMRRLLMQMLPLTGLAEFEFVEARDGLEALARFHPQKIDILFVDWKLPRLTGIDFVRQIRASGKARDLPIVMVTGAGTMGHIQDALDGAGADIYITKPYTIDELRRKLSPVVDKTARRLCQRATTRPAALLGHWLRGVGQPPVEESTPSAEESHGGGTTGGRTLSALRGPTEGEDHPAKKQPSTGDGCLGCLPHREAEGSHDFRGSSR